VDAISFKTASPLLSTPVPPCLGPAVALTEGTGVVDVLLVVTVLHEASRADTAKRTNITFLFIRRLLVVWGLDLRNERIPHSAH